VNWERAISRLGDEVGTLRLRARIDVLAVVE
jgi:hypothetical protein